MPNKAFTYNDKVVRYLDKPTYAQFYYPLIVDPCFNTTSKFGAVGTVRRIEITVGDHLYLGGNFTSFDSSVGYGGIVKTDSELNLDTTFQVQPFGFQHSYTTADVKDMYLDPYTQEPVCAGYMTVWRGAATQSEDIAKLTIDGSLDYSFDPSGGIGGDPHTYQVRVDTIEYDYTDGAIYAGGMFQLYDGITRNGVVKINSDGTLNTQFDSSTGIFPIYSNELVLDICHTNDKVYIGGCFYHYNGTTVGGLVRVNPSDGKVDIAFDMSVGFNVNQNLNQWKSVNTITPNTLNTKNQIFVGGSFTAYRNQTRKGLVLLNPDGTEDASFNIGSGFLRYNGTLQGDIKKILIDSTSNAIYVSGFFEHYNGIYSPGLVKLDLTGKLDTVFTEYLGNGFSDIALRYPGEYGPYDMAFDSSGHLYCVGKFSHVNGQAHSGVCRFVLDNVGQVILL